MKTVVQRAGRVLALAVLSLSTVGVAVVGPVAPAHAGCVVSTTYVRTGTPAPIWLGSNEYSSLLVGPGTIAYTISNTGTTTATASATFTVSAGVIVSASAALGFSLSSSTTLTRSWVYNLNIPSGMTARAHWFKRGYRIPTRKYYDNALCQTTVTNGYTYAPITSNSTAYYCLTRDVDPITKVMNTSTCGNT